MSANDVAPQLDPIHAADTAGDQLRRARESLNLSLREVASDLNLMVSHVRGMEMNRCAHLTNDKIFLRHMRSYATLVGIDAEEFVELYRSQSAATEAALQTLPTKRFNVLARCDSKWYAVGVLALACVSLGIWSLNQASPAKATGSTASSPGETAQKSPAAESEAAGKDLVEVAAVNDAIKTEAGVAGSTISAVNDTPAVTSSEKVKPTTRAGVTPAGQTLARSAKTALASDQKPSRESSGNEVQYKNALRSLGAKPLRKTLIELTSDRAEQNKS